MVENKRNIHHYERRLDAVIKKIQNNTTLDSKSKELLLKFDKACSVGMHSGSSAVGPAKRNRYLDFLNNWLEWYNKPIVKNKQINLTKDEYIDLTLKLTQDKVKKKNGMPYADETKKGMLLCLNLFLKYLNTQEGYELRFIPKAQHKIILTNPVTIKKELWEDIANAGRTWQEKAIILTGFDSCRRPSEILNIKIKDVITNISKNTGEKIVTLNINITKTNQPAKVKVPGASKFILEWLKRHPERDNENSYLFLISYAQFRLAWQYATKQVLNKTFNPYVMRKSGMTYYGAIITEAQLAYRAGQVVGSKSLRRYINRDELEGEETIEKEYTQDYCDRFEKEYQEKLKWANEYIKKLIQKEISDKKIRKN